MKITVKYITFICALSIFRIGYACDLPSNVSVPDGATATERQMIAADAAVKAYMADVTAYLSCLEAETKSSHLRKRNSDKTETQAREDAAIREHNAVIQEMDVVATAFNKAVTDYESRD